MLRGLTGQPKPEEMDTGPRLATSGRWRKGALQGGPLCARLYMTGELPPPRPAMSHSLAVTLPLGQGRRSRGLGNGLWP